MRNVTESIHPKVNLAFAVGVVKGTLALPKGFGDLNTDLSLTWRYGSSLTVAYAGNGQSA
jgi:hypothetical protein